MALLVKQEIDKTELQKSIAKNLQDKLKNTPNISGSLDLVEDSQYMKGTKKTTSLARLWLLTLFAFLALIVKLIIS